ncbi:hypothetical protein C8R44DRAFT_747087 [Mycena epipterygia]|nr:hypothetical protein C8R44DRAFT_747087 [Mycena epipterygia]
MDLARITASPVKSVRVDVLVSAAVLTPLPQLALFTALPVDLFLLIILYAFGCFADHPKLYDTNRAHIRQVCRYWPTQIDDLPSAWSAVYVSLRHVLPDVIAAIAKARASRLSVYIELSDFTAVAIRRLTPAGIGQFTYDILGALDIMRSSSLSTLKTDLMFAHLIPPESYTRTIEQLISLLPSMPLLTDVRYTRFFSTWMPKSHLHSLQSLSLSDLIDGSSVPWPTLCDMMASLSSLKIMRLVRVDISDIPGDDVPLPVLASLVELRLDVCSLTVNTAVAILPRFRVPRLEKFYLATDTEVDFDAISFFDAPFLADIRYFAIRAAVGRWENLRRMLINCGSVSCLDVRSSGIGIFNIIKSLAASAMPASGDAICRSLKTIIACHGITHTQLVDILVSRNPRVFSKELVIRVRDVSKWDKYELEWYEREGEVLWRDAKSSLETPM